MSIRFELSRNPRLLEQYYTLREQCYRTELGLPAFDGSEESADRQGQILVAYEGRRCVGGARISARLPEVDMLGDLDLRQQTCCIWERLALDPAARTARLVQDFCAQLVAASSRLGYQHAVVLSSLRHARFYRQCHSTLGVPFRIHRAVPDYARGAFANLEHYLSVVHLQDTQALQLAA